MDPNDINAPFDANTFRNVQKSMWHVDDLVERNGTEEKIKYWMFCAFIWVLILIVEVLGTIADEIHHLGET